MYLADIKPKNVINFLRGYRRTAVFAVTPRCNCRCVMCGMWEKPKQHISLSDAKQVIDFLVKNRFLILYLTGGEPTLHPDIAEIVGYASSKGLITTMTSNGTAPPKTMERLRQSGLQSISISLDHYDPQRCEAIRGVKQIMPKQIKSLIYANTLGLRPYALTYLGPEITRDGVEKLIKYVNFKLALPWGFCYPTVAKNSFTLKLERQMQTNLLNALYTILYLKKSRLGTITNTLAYIEDAIRHTENKPTTYPCLAGYTVVYIDWFGDVYPCFIRRKLFNIFDDEEDFKRFNCDLCLANCFREPSYLSKLSFKFALKEAFS
ncbi:MAG: radical SAM protein [Nitrososphaerales archaeon]